jgi:hypothetical protein
MMMVMMVSLGMCTWVLAARVFNVYRKSKNEPTIPIRKDAHTFFILQVKGAGCL